MVKKINLLEWVFIAGLFITPFIFWPWGVPYEVPRVWFVNRWIEVLLILTVITYRKDLIKKIASSLNSITLLIIIFLIVGFVSSITGADLPKSLIGNYYRGDGLITYLHLAVFSLMVNLFWQDFNKRLFHLCLAWGSVLISIMTLVMSILVINFNLLAIPHWENRAVGITFGNPNFLAGYLAVTLPFVFYQIKTTGKIRRLGWILAVILQYLAIVATNSYGGLAIGLLALVGWFLIGKKRGVQTFILLSLISIILITFAIFQQNKISGFVPEGRERIFRKILLGVKKRPILGYGFANSDYAFEAGEWPIKLQHDVYLDKAHSTALEILATSGVAGLTVYLLLIYKVTGILIRVYSQADGQEKLANKVLLLVFILYLVHSQTNIISIQEELFFWMLAGISSVSL
ncbi:O-antigen ligase family protein [Candidatus Gottesmanbacteria bacterium]|nr:O-antigen ligase family protein [Candidatus Gottesmanbacteria bacterium]